jgi:hypothetical protein
MYTNSFIPNGKGQKTGLYHLFISQKKGKKVAQIFCNVMRRTRPAFRKFPDRASENRKRDSAHFYLQKSFHSILWRDSISRPIAPVSSMTTRARATMWQHFVVLHFFTSLLYPWWEHWLLDLLTMTLRSTSTSSNQPTFGSQMRSQSCYFIIWNYIASVVIS